MQKFNSIPKVNLQTELRLIRRDIQMHSMNGVKFMYCTVFTLQRSYENSQLNAI